MGKETSETSRKTVELGVVLGLLTSEIGPLLLTFPLYCYMRKDLLETDFSHRLTSWFISRIGPWSTVKCVTMYAFSRPLWDRGLSTDHEEPRSTGTYWSSYPGRQEFLLVGPVETLLSKSIVGVETHRRRLCFLLWHSVTWPHEQEGETVLCVDTDSLSSLRLPRSWNNVQVYHWT